MIRLFLFIIILAFPISAQQKDCFNALGERKGTLQKHYFLSRLNIQFEKRRNDFENSIKSRNGFYERQEKMREWYKDIVGKLPAKNDLNIVVTKKADFDDYSVEWVAFESLPNHHVTGMFYIPKKFKPPFPAVYIPCGHSFTGKAGETYQKAARLFAINGFAVLVGDPVCQGERLQYLDENGKPVTEERMLMHEILGQHLMLTGSNTLIHELWDNIRCLDFLEQSPVVDKNKLAVAGNSGGGTQATYLAAFDRRIKVAVASCYIATTEKKFHTIGSQDGCQQIWGEGKTGIEEQDFLLMAAPTPVAVLSATEDFFNKDGANSAFTDIEKVYSVLGVPERAEHVFTEGQHGWHKPLREAAVSWCKKWLMNDDTPVVEPDDIGMFTDEECRVTSTGQVLTSFKNERSVADISRTKVLESDKNREAFLKGKSRDGILSVVKELIGFEEPVLNPKVKMIGTVEGDGFKVEKYFLERDTKFGFDIPALLFVPDKKMAKPQATIIIGDYGEKDKLSENENVKTELGKGNSVLVLDVSNTGELKDSGEPHYDNIEFWMAKLALYEGKTLLAYRTEDILIAKRFLKNLDGYKFSDINLISNGLTGPAALHAAFIDGNFNRVVVSNSIKSWRDVADSDYTSNQLGNIVPNVLNYYDMPDLINLMYKTTIKYLF